MSGPLKAIIFDMDGTLADTEEVHRQAFNLAFAEFGFDWQWSPDEYRSLLAISGGKERIRRYLKRMGVVRDEHQELWQLADTVHRRKSVLYRELLSSTGTRLRPGIERLIREALELDLLLGIATSSSRRNVETLLGNTLGASAMEMFRAVATCDVVADQKPAPALYQFALAELGLEPHQCIAIEDTRNGNLSALSAGLKTIITTHGYTLDNDFSGASLVLDQLGEPGRPCNVLAGNALGARHVDVALLQRICEGGRSRQQSHDWSPAPALAAK